MEGEKRKWETTILLYFQRNKGAGSPFSNIVEWNGMNGYKAIMPLKTGVCRRRAASPFLVGPPLCNEPMRTYRRAIREVA